MPVRRTTIVIDVDRTVLTVVSSEVRASAHADQTLRFLEDRDASSVPPLSSPEDRIDSGVDVAIDAPIEALDAAAAPPCWPKGDVRSQILASCRDITTVAEIAARLAMPLGATRFLVDDLATRGYVRIHARVSGATALDERRELLTRTLIGLRAL